MIWDSTTCNHRQESPGFAVRMIQQHNQIAPLGKRLRFVVAKHGRVTTQITDSFQLGTKGDGNINSVVVCNVMY